MHKSHRLEHAYYSGPLTISPILCSLRMSFKTFTANNCAKPSIASPWNHTKIHLQMHNSHRLEHAYYSGPLTISPILCPLRMSFKTFTANNCAKPNTASPWNHTKIHLQMHNSYRSEHTYSGPLTISPILLHLKTFKAYNCAKQSNESPWNHTKIHLQMHYSYQLEQTYYSDQFANSPEYLIHVHLYLIACR
jgi:hypothetical protein